MVVVALCLPLLTAALADVPAFQRAQELYGELEFEQAIFELEQAALVEELTPEERATVLAWLGLCHAQVRREAESRRYFEMAVRQDADVALPSFAPPAVVNVLDEVRAAAASAPSEPDPAEAETAPPVEPAPTEQPDAAAAEGPSMGVTTGVALGVLGGLTVVTGGVLLALAVPSAQQAGSTETFQDDAIAAANVANVEIAAGSALLGAGVLAGVGGAALAFLWPE